MERKRRRWGGRCGDGDEDDEDDEDEDDRMEKKRWRMGGGMRGRRGDGEEEGE